MLQSLFVFCFVFDLLSPDGLWGPPPTWHHLTQVYRVLCDQDAPERLGSGEAWGWVGVGLKGELIIVFRLFMGAEDTQIRTNLFKSQILSSVFIIRCGYAFVWEAKIKKKKNRQWETKRDKPFCLPAGDCKSLLEDYHNDPFSLLTTSPSCVIAASLAQTGRNIVRKT